LKLETGNICWNAMSRRIVMNDVGQLAVVFETVRPVR
jgi:hypothetical protein